MATKLRTFPLGPSGEVRQFMMAGDFAALALPSRLPQEGEGTADQPWGFQFTRFASLPLEGGGQAGTWRIACFGLAADSPCTVSVEAAGPRGIHIAASGRDWAEGGRLDDLQIGPEPLLVAIAVPADASGRLSARVVGDDLPAIRVVHLLDLSLPIRIQRAAGRDVWVRAEGKPKPLVWVELMNVSERAIAAVRFELESEQGIQALGSVRDLKPGQAVLAELAYNPDKVGARGTLIARAGEKQLSVPVRLHRTAPDWVVHLVPHFHYDPVWWNTQANYVEHDERSAFNLIRQYLQVCRDEPDYTFVLEQVPYTKPFWDTFPDKRAEIEHLMAEGRLQVVGALYNEPQSTIVGPEANLRNIAYGTAYHRRQWGAERLDGWMLDVFGHEPNFPQMMAQAEHETVAYARGPYKRCWGIPPDRLNFPVEYWWQAPDGSRLLARLLEPNSYGLGDSLRQFDGPEAAWWHTADLFERASAYTAAHLQIWTVGGDFRPPIPWLAELARRWNAKYVSPKLLMSTPARYFSDLARFASDPAALPAMTRDLDPVNNGCDISYIDTKLANRACEALCFAAEAAGSAAGVLAGKRFPAWRLDLAWRQLLFGAHHDALTGSESDQVYVDLVAAWREAYDQARSALEEALDAATEAASPTEIAVFNPLPWRRDGLVEVELEADPGDAVCVFDGDTPLLCEVVRRAGAGLLRFVARDLPAMGLKTYTLKPGQAPQGEVSASDCVIENEFFRVEVDPQRGGGIVSLVEKASGRELVQEGRVANDLVAHREYEELPGYGEGPWHVCTTGEKHLASEECPAQVRAEKSALRASLVVEGSFLNCRRRMTITLFAGVPAVFFEAEIADYSGENWLFKVHFPLNLPGARPVYEVGGAVVSRTYCPGDQDTAELPWTQDNAALHYVDLTVPLVLKGTAGIGGEEICALSAGMAEIVVPEGRSMAPGEAVDELLRALSSIGVSATLTWPRYRRFGDIAWDSNVPDFRIVVGGPEENEFTKDILEALGPEVQAELRDWIERHAWAVALLPRVQLGLPAEIPIVLVWADSPEMEKRALAHIAVQLRQFRELVGLVPAPLRSQAPGGKPASGGVALLNRGNISYCCYADQTLTLSLMRSCTGWPSGLWIDPPKRTCPDGSGFQLEHWAHCFQYALVFHPGHWQDSGLWRIGMEFNHPPVAAAGRRAISSAEGRDVLSVHPDNVVVLAAKPAGAACGQALDEALPGGLVVRICEASGREADVLIRSAMPIARAWLCNALEEPTEELEVHDGGARLELGQFEIATVMLEFDGRRLEAEQPPKPSYYARWWRYNRGAAPEGFVPLAVLLGDGAQLRAEPGAEIRLPIVISAGYCARGQSVACRIEAPEGVAVDSAELSAQLGPGEYVRREIVIRANAPGLHPVYAVAESELACAHDCILLAVGDAPQRPFEAEIEPEALRPGEEAVRVRVRNVAAGPLRVDVQLAMPYEAWPIFEQAAASGVVKPGEEGVFEFATRRPWKPTSGWLWVLAKVAAAGRLIYTESIRLNL